MDPRNRPRRPFVSRRLSSGAARLALTLLVILGLFAAAQTGRARLQPYYVVKGVGLAQLKPRVLFVLDTSGSMKFRVQDRPQSCPYAECEMAEASGESRISAARRAIRVVTEAAQDQASFGLMTFAQRSPPRWVPPKCSSGRRFVWAERVQYHQTRYPYEDFPWELVNKYEPDGMWVLCDDRNRPYPYLRWDELGVGSVIASNDETGPIPPSPLISTRSGDIDDSRNAERRVQWFPEFMGVRAQLNDSTDPDRTVLEGTYGDYADSSGERLSEVWGQDFYYWPYVDGFPSYSGNRVDPNDRGWYGTDNADHAGVVDRNGDGATLYAPFYMDLDGTVVDPALHGPASADAATFQVLSHTAPMIEGGVDTDGGTPWRDAIGSTPSSPPQDNSPRSHSTVASYLKFAVDGPARDVCAPATAVLVTDGDPSSGQGGYQLYERLAALRNTLGVRTYVVGFLIESDEIEQMACSAAGACDGSMCATPCDDTPAEDWDTCAEPGNPQNCAYRAGSSSELVEALTRIVDQQVELDAPSGPGSSINDFGVASGGDPDSSEAIVQTKVNAHTEYPSWRGHVVRELCDDLADPSDPTSGLASWCQLPDPEFKPEDEQPRFGPCDPHRTWDAGECLRRMDYRDRRLWTHDAQNNLIPINDADGSASAEFEAELASLGLLDSSDRQAEADAIAEFIAGKDWPDGWKLPGLASSAPVVVRRIPQYDPELIPSIPIRDPHCAGRFLGETENANLPPELVDFAEDAWSNRITSPAGEHLEYQEAVLVGDDLGMLHAFHLDSGNEMWGLLPRFLLDAAVQQAAIGPENRGQPEAIEDHIYGISATINHGWVHDADAGRWRHVGVFGLGAGGSEYLALDLSHMSPDSPAGPLEILWTSEDSGLAAQYDEFNGKTWSRPALTYELPNYQLSGTPRSYVVMGSGYGTNDDPTSPQGRTLMLADAVTGEIRESAILPSVTTPVYEPDFGAVVDPSVASHCRSRYWAEMEETYVADPAGRLFRWDLGTNGDDTRDHEADSDRQWAGSAQPVTRFPACEGTGGSCSVSSGNKGDVFLFSPAVTANDRIDDFSVADPGQVDGIDQFLLAMISGSPAEDTIDGADEDNEFHSSLYLLVDDHRGADDHEGFSIPVGAPKAAVGEHPGYVRMALSDIERERCLRYPSDPDTEVCETRRFSRATRPIRPPRIVVRSVIDQDTVSGTRPPAVIDEAEQIEITFTVYEPGEAECDPRWYDDENDEWHMDRGSTYAITFRLFAADNGGFDFLGGYQGSEADFGERDTGLVMNRPRQITASDCPGGNCGPRVGAPGNRPCDNDADMSGTGTSLSVPLSRTELTGFSPVE